MRSTFFNVKHQSSVSLKAFYPEQHYSSPSRYIIVIKNSFGIDNISTNDLDRCHFFGTTKVRLIDS